MRKRIVIDIQVNSFTSDVCIFIKDSTTDWIIKAYIVEFSLTKSQNNFKRKVDKTIKKAIEQCNIKNRIVEIAKQNKEKYNENYIAEKFKENLKNKGD
jgi:hypothetical protein